jgi:hypothetical protein
MIQKRKKIRMMKRRRIRLFSEKQVTLKCLMLAQKQCHLIKCKVLLIRYLIKIRHFKGLVKQYKKKTQMKRKQKETCRMLYVSVR